MADHQIAHLMKPKDIAIAYDQITHLWERSDFNLTNGIAQHNRALSFVKNKNTALDIGCGCTGRFIELLLNQGMQPTGLDISTKMLNVAQRKHPNVEFINADICLYPLHEMYDFITAWDSIWHIPLAEQRGVLKKIVNSLNSGGIFIFSFGGVSEAGEHENNSMGPIVYYSSLGTNGFLQLFIDLKCVIKHLEVESYPDLHSYLIIQKL